MPRSPQRPAGQPPTRGATSRPSRKVRPAEVTHREALWYVKRIEQRAPLVLTFRDGEELLGVLDWYDHAAYRLGLADGGHLVVQKSAVRSLRPA